MHRTWLAVIATVLTLTIASSAFAAGGGYITGDMSSTVTVRPFAIAAPVYAAPAPVCVPAPACGPCAQPACSTCPQPTISNYSPTTSYNPMSIFTKPKWNLAPRPAAVPRQVVNYAPPRTTVRPAVVPQPVVVQRPVYTNQPVYVAPRRTTHYAPAPVVTNPLAPRPVAPQAVVARPVAPRPVMAYSPVVTAAPVATVPVAPAPVAVGQPAVARTKYYYPGQPVRNTVRWAVPY